MTLLRAPSGYGKTILARQWVQSVLPARAPVAWCRLPRSGDAATAWDAIATALTDANLRFPPGNRASPMRIQRALLDAEAPITLVLDDFDHTTDEVDDELVDLIRNTTTLRVIVGLRDRRRLPPHQVLDLAATTVEAAALLFTEDEVARLAAGASRTDHPAIAASVHTQCGGWPALTRAVLHQIAEAGEHEDLLGLIEGVTRQYVIGRLLPPSTPPARREFVVMTAVGDHLPTDVAEQLAGPPSSRALLDDVLAEGLLTARTIDGESVYAWPPAVRRALADEVDQLPTERRTALHSRLARSYGRRSRPDLALHHGVLAREWPQVVKTLDTSWRTLLVHHRAGLAAAAVATPVKHLRRSRRAAAMRDVILQASPDTMLSSDLLPQTPQALDELGRAEDADETVDTALAVLVALRNCAPIEQARDYAVRLLRVTRTARQNHPARLATLYPSVLAQVGVTLMYAGDLRAAIEPIREAYRRAEDGPFDYLRRETASKLALIHALHGDLRRAEIWLHRHDTSPTPTSWLGTFIDPVGRVARLLTALDRLELPLATQAADSIVRHVYPDRAWTWQVLARGMLALHDGTATNALEFSAQVNDPTLAGNERSVVGAPLRAAMEADLLLSLGRGGHARALLHGEHAGHPALRIGQARLALLSGEPADTLRLLDDPGWEQSATIRQRHESLFIRAVAAHRVGDDDTALHALRQAASAAKATGSLRAFTMAPRADLERLADRVPVARELLSREPLASHPDPYPTTITLVSLSPRERLVLQRLAAGLNLREAAASLVVSYNTIRSQQASLYRKLGVNDRTEAIARARQQGLL